MMALVDVLLKTLLSEPDALTTRPPPCLQTLSKRKFVLTRKIYTKKIF